MCPLSQSEAGAISSALANPTDVVPLYSHALRKHGFLVLETMEDGTARAWADDAVYRYASREAFDHGDSWLGMTGRGNIVVIREAAP